MTDTAVQPAAAEDDHWLSRFEEALAAGDSAAASELFADDGLWRDLVSMNGWAADLISQEVATRSARCGDSAPTPPRTPVPGRASSATWKPTHAEGIDTPVYRMQEVHHLS